MSSFSTPLFIILVIGVYLIMAIYIAILKRKK